MGVLVVLLVELEVVYLCVYDWIWQFSGSHLFTRLSPTQDVDRHDECDVVRLLSSELVEMKAAKLLLHLAHTAALRFLAARGSSINHVLREMGMVYAWRNIKRVGVGRGRLEVDNRKLCVVCCDGLLLSKGPPRPCRHLRDAGWGLLWSN